MTRVDFRGGAQGADNGAKPAPRNFCLGAPAPDIDLGPLRFSGAPMGLITDVRARTESSWPQSYATGKTRPEAVPKIISSM